NPSAIFKALKSASCQRIVLHTDLKLSTAAFSKIRGSKRKSDDYLWFATAYPGSEKEKLAVSVVLHKAKGRAGYHLAVQWFPVHEGPPKGAVPFETFEERMKDIFQEQEADVRAEFRFDSNHYTSLFKRIDIADLSPILDQIIGFTGIKRDPAGKVVYTLEAAFSDKSISHIISFRQTVKLDDNTPLALIETANKIVSLAIKPKEA